MQQNEEDNENLYILKSSHLILEESEDSGALHLGDIIAAENAIFLKNNNISCIVSVAKTRLLLPKHLEIDILSIPVDDSPIVNLKKHFQACFKFLNEKRNAKKNVLVHCMAGVSRSSTIVIGYIMSIKEMGFEEAYQFVKQRRSIVSPNGGFLRQLKEYELEMKKVEEKSDKTNQRVKKLVEVKIPFIKQKKMK